MMLPGLLDRQFMNEAAERNQRVRTEFFEAIARAVQERETRRELPEKDSFVQYLKESSGREKLSFEQKIRKYADEMDRCTAEIEARLATQAANDLSKGDYVSSRIKPYAFLLCTDESGRSLDGGCDRF